LQRPQETTDNGNNRMTTRGNRFASLFADMNMQNVSAGLISALLIMTGPAIIVLEAAANGNLTDRQTIDWMFAIYFFSGLMGVLMSLRYRIPITGGHSMSGIVFMSTITAYFTYPQLIGGFLLSGLLILIVGLSGIFTKMMQWVPKEVISAMMAGLIAGYVIRLIPALAELPIVGSAAAISYLLLLKFGKRIPPALGAIVVAIITLLATQRLDISGREIGYSLPTIHLPEFSWMGLISFALPLAMLVLSNDVAPGIGALSSAGYEPPIRKIVSVSGIFSMITGFFGGQCANIAGMMTSICADADSGPKTKRYVSSVVSGMVTILFGIFAWKIVPFILALPQALISMLAGFSLIGVLLSNLQSGFASRQHAMGSLTAFVVALSNVSFFQISAPVWALILGAIVAKLVKK